MYDARMVAKASEPRVAYELKVTLEHTRPAVWRQFVVPGEITLDRLHDVIQIVMGWQDCHLHVFKFGEKSFSEEPEEAWEGEEEGTRRLRDLVGSEGEAFEYEYDMGDGWAHVISVLRVASVPEGQEATVACLDGKRCCPPENCGGPPGYENLVSAMKEPKHPERKELIAWLGGKFDPAAFDVEAINVELGKYVRWSRPRLR
jgi:hypothetical protein